MYARKYISFFFMSDTRFVLFHSKIRLLCYMVNEAVLCRESFPLKIYIVGNKFVSWKLFSRTELYITIFADYGNAKLIFSSKAQYYSLVKRISKNYFFKLHIIYISCIFFQIFLTAITQQRHIFIKF